MTRPVTKEEGYCEAWRRVCAAMRDENATSISVLIQIEQCMILFGDPNAPVPLGIIDAREEVS